MAIYTATSLSGDVHFNPPHKEAHDRIKMISTGPGDGPVERSDLVKGNGYEKGEQVGP